MIIREGRDGGRKRGDKGEGRNTKKKHLMTELLLLLQLFSHVKLRKKRLKCEESIASCGRATGDKGG